MAAVQSIGLGSDGALSQDTIDKLKKADESAQINPIQRRITNAKKKNTELSTLLVAIAGVKGAQNPLSEDLSYKKVKTNVSGSSVEAVVSPGVSPQNIKIRVKDLATQDIIQSTSFKLKDSVLSKKNGSIGFLMGNNSFTIKIIGSEEATKEKPATKLEDIPALLAEFTNGKIIGSILNTGGDNPFRLILKSKKPGALNTIFIGTSINTNIAINESKFKNQIFFNADFTINGTPIFTEKTNTSYIGKAINFTVNFPKDFQEDSLKINGKDIFGNLSKTSITSLKAINPIAEVIQSDLTLNGVSVFDTSLFTQALSSKTLESIKFPIELDKKSFLINGIDVFTNVISTTVNSGIIKNQSIRDTYSNGDLIINGVNIFDKDGISDVSKVSDVVNAINRKTDDNNIEAVSIELDDNNFIIKLTNTVNGDSIDITSSNLIKLAKFRLYQGSTKGSDKVILASKIIMLDTINKKMENSNITAKVNGNGSLIIEGKTKDVNIKIEGTSKEFLDLFGFESKLYDRPVPISIKSLDDVVLHINKKLNETNISASNIDGKLSLSNQIIGSSIIINGTDDFLEKIALKKGVISPRAFKKITNKDELVNAINERKDDTNVKAEINKDNELILIAEKPNLDIKIEGKSPDLRAMGLEDSLTLSVDGQKLTTRQDLLDSINSHTEVSKVSAIVQDDKLILRNTSGGNIVISGSKDKLDLVGIKADKSIRVEDVRANGVLLSYLKITDKDSRLQKAQNSKFEYNGVDIIRNNNTIEDMRAGIVFNLKNTDTASTSTKIAISRDKNYVVKSFFDFITSYNALIRKISDSTKFVRDEKNIDKSKIGVFQGESTISNLPNQLSTILGKILPGKKGEIPINSLISLGIDFARDGTLTYVELEIENKINSNIEDVEKLFRGYDKTLNTGKTERIKGIFQLLNDKINDLTKGKKSTLESFKQSIEQETGRLEDTLSKTQKTIDARYEQMKQSFIASDSAISKFTNSFASLKTSMEYETARN